MNISDDAFKTNGWDWVKYRQHARDDEIAMLNAEEQALSSIPDEVVEAASREAFRVDDPGVPIARKRTWEEIPEGGRENYRKLSRAALTAAAPHLMAQAYDEGFEDGKDRYNINPYRSAGPGNELPGPPVQGG